MKKILVYAVVCGLFGAIQAQNFALATFPFKEGLKTEMSTYNKKHDLLSKDFQKVIDTSSSGAYLKAKCKFVSRQYVAQDSFNFTYDLFVKNGNLVLYPGDFLPKMHFRKIFIDGKDLHLPDSLYVGQLIPSIKMKVTLMVDSGYSHNVSILFSELKVERKDTIYSASDTFYCFKISYFSNQELDAVDQGTISLMNNLFFPILGIFVPLLKGSRMEFSNVNSIAKGALWISNGMTIKAERYYLKESSSTVLTKIQMDD